MIVCTGSFKPGYVTYCAERHRVQAVQRPRIRCNGCRPSCHNRMLAVERREATLLCPMRVQPRAGPLQAISSCWFSELLRGAPLSGHSSESAADALRCLPPARHRHCTVCKRRAAELECSFFITTITVCYTAVLYHTVHTFHLPSGFVAIYLECYIAVTNGLTTC